MSVVCVGCPHESYLHIWKLICQWSKLTTVVHAVEPGNVHFTEVHPLADDVIKVWYGGGDGGEAFVLVERKRSVVHDGLIVVRSVEIGDEVILIFVKIVLHSCKNRAAIIGNIIFIIQFLFIVLFSYKVLTL